MFKTLLTIARGRSFEAGQSVADANALTLLDQQIRDATGNLDRARRALAISAAQDGAELRRIEAMRARISELETRAVAALDGGREDLATQAAEAIANLEADLASANAAQSSFARECQKLRAMTANAERRLTELERGRRTARAAEAVRKLRSQGDARLGGGASALRDAEGTLKRLRERQREDEVATNAIETLEGANDADLITEKLAAAGFGAAREPNAQSVLERLRQRRNATA